jgi:hypothetical protein
VSDVDCFARAPISIGYSAGSPLDACIASRQLHRERRAVMVRSCQHESAGVRLRDLVGDVFLLLS